jgi:hypothetical protein
MTRVVYRVEKPAKKTVKGPKAKRMTVLELEQYLKEQIPPNGISREAIYNHIRRAGLTIDALHTVDVADFLEAYLRHRQDDNKTFGAAIGDQKDINKLKMSRLVIEVAILKIRHDQLKGTLVPVTDMHSALKELAQWVKDTHSQWIADVKVLTGDAKVVSDAERLRDNLFARIRARCKEFL